MLTHLKSQLLFNLDCGRFSVITRKRHFSALQSDLTMSLFYWEKILPTSKYKSEKMEELSHLIWKFFPNNLIETNLNRKMIDNWNNELNGILSQKISLLHILERKLRAGWESFVCRTAAEVDEPCLTGLQNAVAASGWAFHPHSKRMESPYIPRQCTSQVLLTW